MMPHVWNHDRASAHIDNKLDDVAEVTIKTFKRDMSLENIAVSTAYRVQAAHIYADIVNLDDMLAVTSVEGELCHKRTLRFLNQHFRAVDRVLAKCDARRVDFANQRLHSLVTKPYDGDESSEPDRVHRAVAVAQMIIDVLDQTGDEDEHIPNAKVRIGVDSGEALAVNNGRRGGREPLFLGCPANIAAKVAAKSKKTGIYLTNNARAAIGLEECDHPDTTRLTSEEIRTSQVVAALEVTADEIVKQWKDDLAANPIGTFAFTRHTPPLSTMDITVLTPGNSRRQEAISIFADLDGFSHYVADHIEDEPGQVVQTLHVIRAELDRVLSSEFQGRRIRYIGDCVHGLMCEGTAHTTDEEASVTDAVLCAGALRSSFNLAIEKLDAAGIDTEGLGLAIGFEIGPMTVSRLGLKGDRVRVSVSRGVLVSEAEQRRCAGDETAIGEKAAAAGSQAVRDLFGSKRIAADLDYTEAVEALAENDETANASRQAAYAHVLPAVAASAAVIVKPYCER
jgi:class 3 adenylate cyclase